MSEEQLGLGLATEVIGDVERALLGAGSEWVIGVDEVGRGPLAGPVTVSAVMLSLDDLSWCDGIDDSKKLSEADRVSWVPRIEAEVVAHATVHVEPPEIDELNILWASMEGMRRAVETVRASVTSDRRGAVVLVDGNRPIPRFEGDQRCLVKGDRRSYAIACASVLAKVSRDSLMVDLDQVYPGYGLAQHKGYPTRKHLDALATLGASVIHRRSFRPVAEALAAAESKK